jgi:hypothetical protein
MSQASSSASLIDGPQLIAPSKSSPTAVPVKTTSSPGPFPANYPAEIVGETPGVTIDCNDGAGKGPEDNVVFTGTAVGEDLAEVISCGPSIKLDEDEACEITVDFKSGAMKFDSV